jgi:hypothetical protein
MRATQCFGIFGRGFPFRSIDMAKANVLKMKMGKLPKELESNPKIKRAYDTAVKDLEAYQSALKSLEGPKKKAGKSQNDLQDVMAEVVDVQTDKKLNDLIVETSEVFEPIWRALWFGR